MRAGLDTRIAASVMDQSERTSGIGEQATAIVSAERRLYTIDSVDLPAFADKAEAADQQEPAGGAAGQGQAELAPPARGLFNCESWGGSLPMFAGKAEGKPALPSAGDDGAFGAAVPRGPGGGPSELAGGLGGGGALVEALGPRPPTKSRVGPDGKPVVRNKKAATFFVSSPGAFSSETRDARFQQGKFDMGNVLQMQLSQDRPNLVCDISTGLVMVTNCEVEELFETTDELGGSLVHRDLSSLVVDEDRDRFSTMLTYLMVSEKQRMDPQVFRIMTLLGHTRGVTTTGVQLIGMWWQLEFEWLRDDAASAQSGSDAFHDRRDA